MVVLCRNDWKIQEIYPSFATRSSVCRRKLIKTSNSEFFVATVYHPPNPEYNQYDLIEISKMNNHDDLHLHSMTKCRDGFATASVRVFWRGIQLGKRNSLTMQQNRISFISVVH